MVWLPVSMISIKISNVVDVSKYFGNRIRMAIIYDKSPYIYIPHNWLSKAPMMKKSNNSSEKTNCLINDKTIYEFRKTNLTYMDQQEPLRYTLLNFW